MTSKAAFTAEEWELLTDSPFWVQIAMTSHRAGGGQLVGKDYVRTLNEALTVAKGSNQLVKEVVAANKGRQFTQSATFNTAKQKLQEIGTLLEQKVDDSQEAEQFRTFLLTVGQKVAEDTSEGLFGFGDKVSSKEVELLDMMKVALKATESDEQRRAEAVRREQAAAAKAKAETEAKAKAEAEAERKRKEAEAAAKAEAEAKAKAEAERKRKEAEAAAKAKAEAEAKAKAEAERKQKEAETAKAKAEAEAKAKAEAEAKAKAEAERKQKEAEAAAKAKIQEAAAKPASTPAQPARVEKPATPVGQTYVVKAGDSLSKIAQAVYGDLNRWREIYEANKDKIPNPNVIEVGQELVLPSGGQAAQAETRIYEVKAGDSLSKIAQTVYGQASRWEEIFQANKDQIKDPAMIHPGQKLRIP